MSTAPQAGSVPKRWFVCNSALSHNNVWKGREEADGWAGVIRNRASGLRKNDCGKAVPLGINAGTGNRRPVGSRKPITRVAFVTLDEVQEGVKPGSGAAGDLLRDLMGLLPTVGFDEPEGLGFRGKARWRGRVSEGAQCQKGGGHDRQGKGKGRRVNQRGGWHRGPDW